METIVVGVDGSGGGAAALEFAAAEAALRKTGLRVVSAWEVPVPTYGGELAPAPTLVPEAIEAYRDRAQQVADDAASKAKELFSLDVEAVAVQGQPADVLLAQAGGAELIVVGRRGLGGFKSLLLGSVSQQVVHHATSPVVVVNEPA